VKAGVKEALENIEASDDRKGEQEDAWIEELIQRKKKEVELHPELSRDSSSERELQRDDSNFDSASSERLSKKPN
jgi:hypothetical protein